MGAVGAAVGSDDIRDAAYTYYRVDGNRLVYGWGILPEAPPLYIPLDGVPEWLVAASTGRSNIWSHLNRWPCTGFSRSGQSVCADWGR